MMATNNGAIHPDDQLLTMSIDLGAEYLKMALARSGTASAMPSVEIVRNNWRKCRTTPMAVYIEQLVMFFGWEASEKAIEDPWHTYTFFLDLIGKKFGDPSVENYWRRFSHLNLRQNQLHGTINFLTDAGEIPVETMLAMVLANARSEVDAYAGQPVRDAVISVPAYFGPAERRAIEDAAQIAGLNLLQLLSAGASAALNYGIFRYNNKEREEDKDDGEQRPQHTILIYDFGSTKVQATIVQVEGRKMETIGFGFDAHFGGHHLTLKVRDHLMVEEVDGEWPKMEGRICARGMAKLTREAERMKQHFYSREAGRILSNKFSPQIEIVGPKLEGLFEENGRPFVPKIRNAQNIFCGLQEVVMAPIKSALGMAKIEADKLDGIFVIGAGAKCHQIQQMLGAFFNNKNIHFDGASPLDPVEAVALGAAYQAAFLCRPPSPSSSSPIINCGGSTIPSLRRPLHQNGQQANCAITFIGPSPAQEGNAKKRKTPSPTTNSTAWKKSKKSM